MLFTCTAWPIGRTLHHTLQHSSGRHHHVVVLAQPLQNSAGFERFLHLLSQFVLVEFLTLKKINMPWKFFEARAMRVGMCIPCVPSRVKQTKKL